MNSRIEFVQSKIIELREEEEPTSGLNYLPKQWNWESLT
jgi:hypothetical protein